MRGSFNRFRLVGLQVKVFIAISPPLDYSPQNVKQKPTVIYDSRVRSEPLWNTSAFEDWPQDLLDAFPLIRDEVLKIPREEWAVAGSRLGNEADVDLLNRQGCWKEFVFYHRGLLNRNSEKWAPETLKALNRIPEAVSCIIGQVHFSALEPGCELRPHSGATNYRLTAHLGLKMEENTTIDKLGIEVGGINSTWREGELLVFDDSFEHRVWNFSRETRIVLLINFWHPYIEDAEEAIQLLLPKKTSEEL